MKIFILKSKIGAQTTVVCELVYVNQRIISIFVAISGVLKKISPRSY